MSREYGMEVELEGYRKHRIAEIKSAVNELWPFEEWDECKHWLHKRQCLAARYTESSLGCGQEEAEFADTIAKAVWKANGGYCQVNVSLTYLEDLPAENYLRNKGDFERLKEVP